MTRRPTPLLVLATLCCLARSGPADESPPPLTAATDVLATVGDSPVFRSEVDEIVKRSRATGTAPGLAGKDASSATTADQQQWLEAAALEQIVDARLLRSEIEREQIAIGRIDVDNRLAQLKQQMAARGLEWERFLSMSGRNEDTVREQIELEIALDRLIRPKLTPTALASGFEKYRRTLDGTRLRVSHVMLRPDAARGDESVSAALARAATIRREIVQGAISFAEAARRYSAGPSRLAGGDLGWISRDTPMIDAFSKEAFAMAKGDVSKPFVTPFGVHVVQVTDVEQGRAGFEALRPQLEAMLAEKILRDLLARLRTSTPVSYAPGVPHFEPASPSDPQAPRRVVGVEAAAPAPP